MMGRMNERGSVSEFGIGRSRDKREREPADFDCKFAKEFPEMAPF